MGYESKIANLNFRALFREVTIAIRRTALAPLEWHHSYGVPNGKKNGKEAIEDFA